MHIVLSRRVLLTSALAATRAARAASPSELRIDWATYNPVSLVLRDQRLLETALAPDGIAVRWTQSAGSNKALEFLNADALDFGSTAGAAALIGRANGNPVRAIYVYSHPEWTALVTRGESPIRTVADVRGRPVAATRGTDPHIFLIRALAEAGLSERDIRLVPLQHADGRAALERGDVDAWAGLDPLMAAAEIGGGARLFYRRPEANTFGVLNVREAFATARPDIVGRVLAAYEQARRWALANPDALRALLVGATKLPDAVIARQLERTDLSSGRIGPVQAVTITEAGEALQKAGVLDAVLDIPALTRSLIDPSFGDAANL